jgi:hypothetical protein
MAINKIHESFLYARNAGADLSAKVNYLAKIDTDGDLILSTAGVGLGCIIEGAPENSPATVQFAGIGKAIVGSGGVSAGARVTSDGSGQLVAAGSAGNQVLGIALETVAQGAIASFIFQNGHVASS